MADTNDEGMSLADVKRRFVDTETQLKSVAEAAMSITKSAEQLDAARDSIGQASQQLGHLAENLRGLTQGLSRATEAIERVDPARIVTELQEVKNGGEAQREAIEALGQQTRAGMGVQRGLLFAVIVAQIVTMALVAWVKFG